MMGLSERGKWETKQRCTPSIRGFTLIELLIVVGILGILAAIAIPMLQDAIRRSRYSRAASDTKTALTQAIIFANDRNRYPLNLDALRNAGYTNVKVRDPWDRLYTLSTVFATQAVPSAGQEAWICSRGPFFGGGCPGAGALASSIPGFPNTGINGAVGYSAIYGSFIGE